MTEREGEEDRGNESSKKRRLDSGALIIKRRSNSFGGHGSSRPRRSVRFSARLAVIHTAPFIKQEECFKSAHARRPKRAVVRLRYQIFSAVRNYKASAALYGFIRGDLPRDSVARFADDRMKMIDSTTDGPRCGAFKAKLPQAEAPDYI